MIPSEEALVEVCRELVAMDPIGEYGCGNIGCRFCDADYGAGPSIDSHGQRLPLEHDDGCLWRRAGQLVAWYDDPIWQPASASTVADVTDSEEGSP